MKILQVKLEQLEVSGRWDLDYHLPPVEITKYPEHIVCSVSDAAEIIKTKRDPTKKPSVGFSYIDISSVDNQTGVIARPQELTGEEAPSRARKVVEAYDIIISTCRPTRKAIAVIQEELHGQICSTGFSVIRAKNGVNPFYLHFALRLPSTMEQFRKWSTGSNYPAILDEDVAKTLIPLPSIEYQDEIAKRVRYATNEREKTIQSLNHAWDTSINEVMLSLEGNKRLLNNIASNDLVYSLSDIKQRIRELPPIEEEIISTENGQGEDVQTSMLGEMNAYEN